MRTKAHVGRVLLFLLVAVIGLAIGICTASASGNLPYPRNSSGETYGSLSDATFPGTEPDLVKALGSDGVTVGYVRITDLNGPEPKSLEEALQQSAQTSVAKAIPLYKVDGKTVIGEFVMGPSDIVDVKTAADSHP